MSRVLVCGSREIELYPQELDRVFNANDITPKLIISGGAMGPDTTAIDWARKNNIEYKVFYADWFTHGRKAGILRNIEMVKLCDICIAFWNGKSSGTKFTIDNAKESGKRVIVILHPIYPDGYYEIR